MRRLRHEDRSDPDIDEAVRLLAAAPPLAPSPEREQRVRSAVRREQDRPATGLRLLRPALALVILGCVATAGGAVATRAYVLHLRHRAERATSVTPPVRVAPRASVPARTPVAPPASVAAPAPVAPPAPATAPAVTLRSPPAVSGASESRTATPASPAVARAAPLAASGAPPIAPAAISEPPEKPVRHALGPDAELVTEAIKALRQGHDARAAAALLDRYLVLHPDGVLAEDALALAIEAAVRRGERRAAAALAARYLARYPHGRFADTARRASSPAAPASQPAREGS